MEEEEMLSPIEARALYDEAKKYRDGDGVPVDLNRAAELYVKADIAECPLTKRYFEFDIESHQKKTKLSDRTMEILKIAAENGYAAAQYSFGMRCMIDKSDEQRFEKAFHWLNEASVRGHTIAKCHLADLYARGGGTEMNKDKAFELYLESANLGYGPAQYKVGEYYEKGISVEMDIDKAIHYYVLSSVSGYNCAYYHLGILFEKGEIVEQDLEYALMCYERCCEKGNAAGYSAMYRICSKGISIEKDRERVNYWISKMPKSVNYPISNIVPPADLLKRLEFGGKLGQFEYYYLGMSYLKGDGIEKDVDKAIYYLERSVELGYTVASYKLGTIYESNEFGYEDLEKAFLCYKSIADRNDQSGPFKLYRFYRLGIFVGKDDGKADEIRSRLGPTYKKRLDQIDEMSIEMAS